MEAEPWIALILCPGLSALVCRRLLDRYGDAQALTNAPPAELRQAGVSKESRNWLARPDSTRDRPLP